MAPLWPAASDIRNAQGRSDMRQKQHDQAGRKNCEAGCQAPQRYDQRLVRQDAHVIIPPLSDGL